MKGLCLFGPLNMWLLQTGVYVQLIGSTTRRYLRGQQHGSAWKCIYPKNTPTKNARNLGNL